MTKPKYDKNTQLQLTILQLQKDIDSLVGHITDLNEFTADLGQRLFVLEQARKTQIQINKRLLSSDESFEISLDELSTKPKKSFWSRLF